MLALRKWLRRYHTTLMLVLAGYWIGAGSFMIRHGSPGHGWIGIVLGVLLAWLEHTEDMP